MEQPVAPERLVVEGPGARWSRVSSPSNGLRPVARERLGEIEHLYMVGEDPDRQPAWLTTPVLWPNEDPAGWRRWEAEHPTAGRASGAERLDEQLVWLDLQRDEGLARLDDVSGPIALEFRGDIDDDELRRRVREVAQKYEVGFISSGSGTTDETLAFAAELAGLRALFVWHSQVTDAGLARLRERTELRELRLHGSRQVGNAGLAHLADMTNMVGLDLRSTQVTDQGLQHLHRMTELELLYLSNTQVTAASLQQLRQFPQLRDLAIAGTQIADDDVRHLQGLPLKRLNLTHTTITDAAMKHIAAHTELEMLDIRINDLSDEALEPLSHLPRLRILRIGQNPRITNAALVHLRGLTSLRHLSVNGTAVTRTGARRLQRHLPDLSVSFFQL